MKTPYLGETVHIFYNGDEFAKLPDPQEDKWSNYPPETDTLRLFAFAAESWRANGWDVHRLIATDTDETFDWGGTQLEGCAYPVNRWNLWIKLAALQESFFPLLVSTIDVLNVRLEPHKLQESLPFAYAMTDQIISLQNAPFSCAAFVVTSRTAARRAVQIIDEYAEGRLSPLVANVVSDELLLRHYGGAVGLTDAVGLMTYYPNTAAPLCHIARNLTRPVMNPHNFPVL